MTFITSGLALAGVLAVAIPILIHLLARQRRKPIEWAAMRFLLEAFRKHKRRLRIEQLLLLVVRCLIVALLGVALARPILEAAGIIATGGSRAVYLVMDDGLVSGVVGEDGRTALERHVRQAVDLVNSLGPGDAVGVITAARPSKALLSPPSTDRAAVIDLLQSLTPKEMPTDLPGAFSHVRSAVDESKTVQQQTMVYLFSEFRGGSAALDSPLPATHADATASIKLLASPPSSNAVSNVQVISIDPVRHLVLPNSSDGSEQITVRLARSGGPLGSEVSTVRLAGENLPAMEPKIVQWQPGQSQADVKFNVNFRSSAPPAQTGTDLANQSVKGLTASIDEDALRADNQRHAVLEVRPQIRVLLIDRRSFGAERSLDQLTAGQWIRRALEPRSADATASGARRDAIQIVEVEPSALDVADIRTADVAVLPRPDLLTDAGWSVLRQFVGRNGLLILMPPAEVNVHHWTEHLVSDLQLPWRTGLEVTLHADGLALAEQQPSSELLQLISSDLPELTRPVLANRVLAVQFATDDLRLTIDDSKPPSAAQSESQPLLLFADGSAMMIAATPTAENTDHDGKANVQSSGLVIYLAAAPELSWTNLPSKPLMVPLFQEMVRQGLSVIRASQQWQVGDQPNLAANPSARQLIGPQGDLIAVDQSGKSQNPLERPGVYVVQDQSNQSIGKLAVNIDAGAGLTTIQSAAAVTSWLNASGPWEAFDASNLAASLAADHTASPIAGMLLLMVLALAVIETILARRFSHAYAEGAGEAPPPRGGLTMRSQISRTRDEDAAARELVTESLT